MLRRQGIGKRRQRTLVAEGKLHRVHRGIYVDALRPREVLDALSLAFPQIAFAGKTAAELHLDREITFPIVAEGPRTIAGEVFQITRSRLPAVTRVRGLRVVEVLWAARGGSQWSGVLLEREYRGRDGRARLEADLRRMRRVPASLRRLISGCAIGCDSAMERTVVRELLERGHRVHTNRLIGPYRFDIELEQYGILIELDGEKYHGNSDSFISDRRKGNSGAIHGRIVLRFSDSCIRWGLPTVLAEIEQAIAWVRAGRRIRGAPPGFPAGMAVWQWHQSL